MDRSTDNLTASGSKPKAASDAFTEVFVGNLSPQTSAQSLRSFAEKFGPLQEVQIKAKDGKSRHEAAQYFGFITFKNSQDAKNFAKMKNGAMFDGRKIRLNLNRQAVFDDSEPVPDVQWNCTHLHFGVLIDNKFSYPQTSRYHDIQAKFSNVRKELTVSFSLPKPPPPGSANYEWWKSIYAECFVEQAPCKLVISYEKIVRCTQSDGNHFYIDMESPPQVCQRVMNAKGGLSDEYRRIAASVDAPDFVHHLSKYYTLHLKLEESVKLEQFDILKNFYIPVKHSVVVPDQHKDPDYLESLERDFTFSIPQEIRWQLHSLASFNLIHPIQINKQFLSQIAKYLVKYGRELVAAALQDMWDPQKRSPYMRPMKIVRLCVKNRLKRGEEIIERNPDMVRIKRAIVTPLKIYFVGPMEERSNRLLRKYPRDTDRFMRVSFADEDMNKLSGLSLPSNNELVERVRRILGQGIHVACSKYLFTIFSSSQLRGHDCWFYSPKAGLTAETLIANLGDFHRINIVGKYAARCGQCLSSTTATIPVEKVIHLEDITTMCEIAGQQVQKTFTDGIGQLSPELAKQIADFMELSFVPSAFQIRFGGCKGVLAVHPGLSGPTVAVRPSMIKFESKDQTILEICSWSHPIAGYLNRQIITLMNGLGIPNQTFVQMQGKFIKDIDKILTSSIVARKLLCRFGSTYRDLHALLQDGFPVDEPFIQACLILIRQRILKDLKTKTRLMVKKSRLLIGVIDETNTLDYGQIFIQYSEASEDVNGKQIFNYDKTKVLEGPVVIAKCPCLHPGDCRLLTAIDVPALHHLKDVIVFPAKGKRPHTDECSGSDLDGDQYFATWNKKLLNIENQEPMSYIGDPPNTVKEEVTLKDLQEFLVEFMKSDSLGIIANNHMASADKYGIHDPRALALASLHSSAVDFPKSGRSVQIHDENKADEYPDFMQEKAKKKTIYESDKALGMMWAQLKDCIIDEEVGKYREAPLSPHLRYGDYMKHLPQAQADLDAYEFRVRSLMNQFGIAREAEIIHGDIVKMHWCFKKKHNFWDSKETISQQLREIVKSGQRNFWREFVPALEEDPSAKTLREEILTKASCYYYATYVRMECPTLSFPWMVVPKLLSAILTGDDDHFLQAVHLVPRIFSQPRGRPKEGITNEFF